MPATKTLMSQVLVTVAVMAAATLIAKKVPSLGSWIRGM